MAYPCVHFGADLMIYEIRLIFKVSLLLRISSDTCFAQEPDTSSQTVGHKLFLKLNMCFFVHISCDLRVVISFSLTLHEASIYGSDIKAWCFPFKMAAGCEE